MPANNVVGTLRVPSNQDGTRSVPTTLDRMNRTEMLHRAADRREPWDVVVVGKSAIKAFFYGSLDLLRGVFGVGVGL